MPTKIDIQLPHLFTPRPYQIPLMRAIDSGVRRAVSVWHRRAGKDKTILNILTKEAFKRVGAYYYFLPTYSQGQKIIWNGMDREGLPFLSHIPKDLRRRTVGTTMLIELVNGSIIQIVGSDSIDSIVGTNPIGCVFSEYSLQDPRGWDFIRPILLENGGWALFNFTPRGHNHAYDLYKMAESNPDWFCDRLTISDTGALTEEDVQSERDAGMSEDLIQQEFYCSFDAAIAGAYFAHQLQQARDEGRILDRIEIEPDIPVDTWWDLGVSDTTCIWMSQTIGKEIRIVDFYEESGEGLPHYADMLKSRGYQYGRHVAPHDIEVRELGSGQSRKQIALDLGINFETCPRVGNKLDSIEAARSIFGRVWFGRDKCQRGIDALASYHKAYDDKRQVYQLHPVHDWASHPADAFQTLAMAHDHNMTLFTGVKRRSL